MKTKIVYCKDDDRPGTHEDIKFDFLGYAFQPRRAKNRTAHKARRCSGGREASELQGAGVQGGLSSSRLELQRPHALVTPSFTAIEVGDSMLSEVKSTPLAAIRYQRGFDIDELLFKSCAQLRSVGLHIGGVLQQASGERGQCASSIHVVDLRSGQLFDI